MKARKKEKGTRRHSHMCARVHKRLQGQFLVLVFFPRKKDKGSLMSLYFQKETLLASLRKSNLRRQQQQQQQLYKKIKM